MMKNRNVEKAFLTYADSFLTGNESDDYHYILKRDHSMRVKDLCSNICRTEGIEDQFTEAAVTAAIVHDIGRFEQFRQFHTFRDASSVDHGSLGAEIIDKLDILSDFSPEIQTAIKYAVAQHNQMNTEPGGEFENLLTRIIRDSDKLDIYNVILSHLNGNSQAQEVLLHLPDTDEYSQEIIDDIYAGRTICYTKRRTVNDMKLTILNWIQDMNFKFSYKHVLEKNYINIFCDSLPCNPEMYRLREFFLEYASARAS